MAFTHTRTRLRDEGENDPMAGFELHNTTTSKIYLLQVKTESVALDNALYSLAHPTAIDATRNPRHEDVVSALEGIARVYPEYKEIATELAEDYRRENGLI